ncbi:hypothetical protein WG66_014432 [Moniliophthora roreri]|nr:hypothetical protein WG66_014432 [Moniliophthora roreri]
MHFHIDTILHRHPDNLFNPSVVLHCIRRSRCLVSISRQGTSYARNPVLQKSRASVTWI